MQLTEQQKKIVELSKTSNYLRINAFAGSGKTSVLQAITNTYTDKTFLYLVFNKGAATEAEKRFGENTKIYTINGLAYHYTRDELGLGLVRPSMKVVEIKNHLNIHNYDIALMVQKVFDSFCNSDYKDINTKICKQLILENEEHALVMSQKNPSLSMITQGVASLWNDMYKKRLEPVHGFYLKYFHLALDRIKSRIKYDYILLDECQDTNAITLDVFNNLNGKKIIVGDKFQQIYGFRGTINAMESFIKSEDQLYLSETFRFNDAIAQKANFLLNDILGEPESIISHFPDKTGKISTRCCISRTNSGIIKLFVHYTDEGKIVKTIRNPDEIFRLPLSVFYFLSDKSKNKNKIEVKWLYNFRGRNDMKEHAESMNDVELLTSIKLVEEYWDDLIKIYEKAKANRRKKKCDFLLATAHTVKGLEFDEVNIHDDFPDLLYRISRVADSMEDFKEQIKNKNSILSTPIQKTIEEVNLFYVAITRATYILNLNFPNSNIFGLSQEEMNNMIVSHREAEKIK